MSSKDVLNPIRSRQPLTLLSFGTASRAIDGHSALVYLTGTGPDDSSLRPPTFFERLHQPYWLYEIDTACHWTALTLALPAEEEAFSFRVWVSLNWQVREPIEVARVGLDDLRPVIWGLLDQQLRLISRRYSIEHSGRAEEEMTSLLEQKLDDIGYGIRLGLVSVNVRLDEAAERYLATRVESRRARDLAGDDHDLETLRRGYTAEIARMQGQLEREQAAHSAEIQRMRDEQEARADEQQLALKQQRLSFYESALRSGGYGMVMLHLIEHPQDVQSVLGILQEGRREDYDRARSVLETLLNNNLINAADAEPMRDDAIERLRSAFDLRPQSVTVSKEVSEKIIEKESTETLSAKMDFT